MLLVAFLAAGRCQWFNSVCWPLNRHEMTGNSAEAAKELLALDPEQEAEFKSKVREAKRKKNKANVEGKPSKVGLSRGGEIRRMVSI